MKSSYSLLDSGDLEKLELLGGYRIIRPSLNSFYKKSDPKLWSGVDAHYIKNDRGSGEWKFFSKIPEIIKISLNKKIQIQCKLTPFGHIGFFPEQQENWDLLSGISRGKRPLEVLNLFAYSGVSTLYSAMNGMNVCHVDASKGMVDWARENSRLSNLENSNIRWIVDDVQKFVMRETRRGRKYDGFILDPPSFGRGAKGEIWKIEKDLIPLLDSLMELRSEEFRFVFLSCHTSGFSPLTLDRLLKSYISDSKENFTELELYVRDSLGNKLPGGFCARYIAD